MNRKRVRIWLYTGDEQERDNLREKAKWIAVNFLNQFTGITRSDYTSSDLSYFWNNFFAGGFKRDDALLIKVLEEGGPNGENINELPIEIISMYERADNQLFLRKLDIF